MGLSRITSIFFNSSVIHRLYVDADWRNLSIYLRGHFFEYNFDNPTISDKSSHILEESRKLELYRSRIKKHRNFQNSCVTETSLSVFHKLMATAFRMQFRKTKPKVLFYRDYTKFSNETCIKSLKVKLGAQSICPNENRFLNIWKICT